MLLLGIDVGTSSVKVSVVDSQGRKCISSAQFPETEAEIIVPEPGWAEQRPEMWWEQVQQAILKCHASGKYNPKEISAIGIAYQMHGLVLVDKDQNCLRNSIIWCDSRTVDIGNRAFGSIGREKSLTHMLNSPGNFTASKLGWVKENEPEIFAKADKLMLPGDFIAMKLTNEITTSVSALSEGVFWDFVHDEVSTDVMSHFGFSRTLLPEVRPVFSEHGRLSPEVASLLGLSAGINVTYKSGDQPNNALSLNVLKPGEVAATAGTSGVIYGVSDKLIYDNDSRINSFAHVNYSGYEKRIGVLLCINGVGILNKWVKALSGAHDYGQLNEEAATIKPGSDGLRVLPFGNGAERMLNNKIVGAHFKNIDLNIHSQAHVFRASQEGIAFAFRYGLDIMRENGMDPQIIRVGKANLFLSEVFCQSFVDACNNPVELYENDGSVGAAIGAGIGAGAFNMDEAFAHMSSAKGIEPRQPQLYEDLYQDWKLKLTKELTSTY